METTKTTRTAITFASAREKGFLHFQIMKNGHTQLVKGNIVIGFPKEGSASLPTFYELLANNELHFIAAIKNWEEVNYWWNNHAKGFFNAELLEDTTETKKPFISSRTAEQMDAIITKIIEAVGANDGQVLIQRNGDLYAELLATQAMLIQDNQANGEVYEEENLEDKTVTITPEEGDGFTGKVVAQMTMYMVETDVDTVACVIPGDWAFGDIVRIDNIEKTGN